MNLMTGEVSRMLFGEGSMPDSVRRLIDQAVLAPPEHREALLWTARASAPGNLAIYYLLYKFYATQRNLPEAERAARRGLAEAASQAGLTQDWRAVKADDADFSVPGAARFWLFTLKALAFIGLRAGNVQESREILKVLGRLDPADSVGGGVVEALISSASSPR